MAFPDRGVLARGRAAGEHLLGVGYECHFVSRGLGFGSRVRDGVSAVACVCDFFGDELGGVWVGGGGVGSGGGGGEQGFLEGDVVVWDF